MYVSGLPAIEHVQNVLFLPDRTGPTDNDAIKAAVQTYGAVYTAMYADYGMADNSSSAYYDKTTHAYYYDGSAAADHAVDIVGWDDSYSRTNFATDPGMDGAFIVRNSWGTGHGELGYYYISYEDALIGTTMAVFTGEPASDYAQNLGYDKLGFTGTVGYGDDTAWMAAGFSVRGDSSLEAASFYAQSPGTTYDVYVGSNLNDPDVWTAACSGTIDAAGYHTVAFNQGWPAKAGVKFYVIVHLTTPTTTAPIPLEEAWPGYSSKATTAAGQSYISADGTAGSWTDIGVASGSRRADVCLKVFAGPATPIRSGRSPGRSPRSRWSAAATRPCATA